MSALIPAGAIYTAMLFELAYMLYSFGFGRKKMRMIAEGALFLVFLLLLSFLSVSRDGKTALPSLLLVLFLAAAAMIATRSVILLAIEHRRNKERLSGYSLKQAVDNMDMGILFADPSGQIILINRVMEELAAGMTGRIPQSVNELGNLDGMSIYEDGKGHKWEFTRTGVAGSAENGFMRMIAWDVTELLEYNKKLEDDNGALLDTNGKLKAMYEHLADSIREEETLKLRIRIHNDMGCSLIYLRELLETGDDVGMDRQLDILKDVLSYLRQGKDERPEDLADRAAEMGVRLVTDGSWPENEKLKSITGDAVMECVTNCVKHAGGDEVTLRIEREGSVYRIRISNNGRAPDGEIREGGGLGSIRRRIMECGGNFSISSAPVFAMEITLEDVQDDKNGDS
ncbi:MAG: hypothetical protein K6C95_01035 [Lachnospiraceae bacterium]|nr:hypothetical protein [Lachnospiraceae bacterium]